MEERSIKKGSVGQTHNVPKNPAAEVSGNGHHENGNGNGHYRWVAGGFDGDDDAALMSRISHGVKAERDAAMAELVNRLTRYLFGVAFKRTGNNADAEDVLQDTLVKVLEHSRSFAARDGLSQAARSWLAKIASHTAIDAKRTSARQRRYVNEAASQRSELYLPANDRLESADTRQMLARAMRTLAREHRRVVVRHYFRGESVQVIAAAEHRTTGAIYARLRAAERAMRVSMTPS